ncbi:type VI secretion system ATPase TssH [uncultured Shewanella sp.]|uniref:type VI secretion system ATPase TssH n=1 Tax=uncultured Shewanella sp. TaxID=173975 RepID=UPI002609DA83|nr:type VI secretion system ATPase TssH [uncultured Shewanella sp.]
MMNVDLKTLLSKLNYYSSNSLHNAAGYCMSRTHYEVTIEHWLLKCLEAKEGDLCPLLESQNVDVGELIQALNRSLEDNATGNSAKPAFSSRLIDLLTDAWLISSVDLNLSQIRSGTLLLVLLSKPMSYGQASWFDALRGLPFNVLLKQFFSLVRDSAEVAEASSVDEKGDENAGSGSGFIDRFCTDFTAKAQKGSMDPVFGRDEEIRQIVDILARRRKNNPILVGEPGVGKTAVIEGLALRIIEGDVPDVLADVRLLGLDMSLLEAGAGMKGEFENRLKGVIDEIKASVKPIILFIDEAHTLIGAGGSAGTSDAANLLKPALARGELKTCAATTWGEYKKYFEKDPALARRFQLVKLDEPSVEVATLIVRGLREYYEKAHGVAIRDDALAAAASFSDRYITGRFLPDKAIDLMDTACARVKVNLKAMPAKVEDTTRHIQALERNLKGIQKDLDNGELIEQESIDLLEAEIEQYRIELDLLTQRWQTEKQAIEAVLLARRHLAEATPDEVEISKANLTEVKETLVSIQGDEPLMYYEVSPDLIAQVVSDWTGIPLGKMARDQASVFLNLDKSMQAQIKGQDDALIALSDGLRMAKSGLSKPDQPMGVFLLVGPSGVGKTETALTLAELLFGSTKNLITINMSEFQEKHSVSRLIGSPPGYVGYGEGGMLTEAVRQQPYSVVLLDEVEKAHPEILNIFYQVFDKGTLSDGEGKEINFRNTVVLLTSNLATDVIVELSQQEGITSQMLSDTIRPMLNEYFKPALLARMNLLPYKTLQGEQLKEVVKLKLTRLAEMLQQNNGTRFSYTKAVVDQIAERCTDVETGARNIDFILNGSILPELSRQVLAQMGQGEMPEVVTLNIQKGEFTFKFGE